MAQRLKLLPEMWETGVQSLGQEDPLEKEMATPSSIFAWRIPWTEQPGRLQSTGLQSQAGLSYFTFFLSLSRALYPQGLPWRLSGKESTCQCRRHSFDPWVGKIPAVGNGNPLQYSCLENSMNKRSLAGCSP